jgi:uncharacterized surface protein with fasciclin (FAS1) repeats
VVTVPVVQAVRLSIRIGADAATCGNLHTANATVYIINTVLMPMH